MISDHISDRQIIRESIDGEITVIVIFLYRHIRFPGSHGDKILIVDIAVLVRIDDIFITAKIDRAVYRYLTQITLHHAVLMFDRDNLLRCGLCVYHPADIDKTVLVSSLIYRILIEIRIYAFIGTGLDEFFIPLLVFRLIHVMEVITSEHCRVVGIDYDPVPLHVRERGEE